MSSTTSRKNERRQERRGEIVRVASRLFAERGYENVTLRAIAEEMGYAHGTLYRYFPDKANLMEEICRETFALLLAECDAIAHAFPDGRDGLFETSRRVAFFGLAHPQHFRVVFFGGETRANIRAGDYINEIGQPLFEKLVARFSACLEAENLTVSDPMLAAHTWWTALFGLTMVLIIQGQLPDFSPDARVVEQAITTMWAGIKATGK